MSGVTRKCGAGEAKRPQTLRAARYRALAEASGSIVWSADASGAILDMSPQWRTFTGQRPTQYRGDGWLDVVHPDDRVLAAETWARALRSQTTADTVYRLWHTSGQHRFVAVRYVPILDADGHLHEWVGWMADIDARKRAEQERDRFFNLSLDLLCIAGMDGEFRRVNPAFEKTLGFGAEELCSAPFIDFVHRDDRAVTIAEVEKLKQGTPTVDFENRYRCGNGAYRWLAWNVFPAVEQGLLYAAARDVTEQKRAAAQLAEQAARLAEMDKRKDEFLAMLAHELRNPLAPMRAAVGVLRRSPDPDKVAWGIEAIDGQLAQLTHLVDDLLDVARITRGRIELKKAPGDLRAIVGQAVETARPVIGQHRHELHVTLPDQPVPIEVDPLRIGQVLINLLSNAAKYTDDGGLIELEVAARSGMASISVRDNGIGIAPYAAAGLFDVFAQAECSLARAQGGLGLGLTLVKRLTEMHDGKIHVESAGLGLGSTFTVTLPLPSGIAAATNQNPLPAFSAVTPLRVLVVDDYPEVADGLAMLLEALGHDVKVAPNGPAALAAARGFRPQVGILDIGLPGMDGCELATRLRAALGYRPLLLIALTGYGDEAVRERVRRAGFDHHLLKPCASDTLENLLATFEDGDS